MEFLIWFLLAERFGPLPLLFAIVAMFAWVKGHDAYDNWRDERIRLELLAKYGPPPPPGPIFEADVKEYYR